MSKKNDSLISALVDKAMQKKDIRIVVGQAMMEMAEYAEDDSAQQLYDIAEWKNLSPESDEIMFGKRVPDSEGYLPDDEDYDDTRDGDFVMLYHDACILLIKKMSNYIMSCIKTQDFYCEI